jgi:hypothetical protein
MLCAALDIHEWKLDVPDMDKFVKIGKIYFWTWFFPLGGTTHLS